MTDSARNILEKFEALRAKLMDWSRHLSNLKLLINNCNRVISFVDTIDDRRGLFNTKAVLYAAVKRQLRTWLRYKKIILEKALYGESEQVW